MTEREIETQIKKARADIKAGLHPRWRVTEGWDRNWLYFGDRWGIDNGKLTLSERVDGIYQARLLLHQRQGRAGSR